MLAFLLFSLWGLCIGLSLVGYGRKVMRALGCKQSISWIIAPAAGLSFTVWIGSMLNLFGLIQAPIVIAIVVAGLLILPIDAFQNRHSAALCRVDLAALKPSTALSWAGVIAIVCILATRVCAYVLTNPSLFNYHDDEQAYLAFPLKMLQTGSFAPDPFSERRIMSGLGGGVYLQALTIAPFHDLRIINLMDGTIGYLLLIVFGIALCHHLGLSVNRSLVVLFVLAMTPDYRVNTSSIILPGALLLVLALIHIDDAWGTRLSFQKALLMGITTGTGCALKSTIIPSFGVFIVLILILDLRLLPSRKVATAAATIAASASLVLLPWMIDSKAKCGTLLYPLLGHGYHSSSYSYPFLDGHSGGHSWLFDWPTAASAALFAFALVLFKVRVLQADGRKETAQAALVTAAVVVLLFQYVATGVSPRFSMSTLLPVNVVALAVFLALSQDARQVSRFAWTLGPLYATFAIVMALTVFRTFATGNVLYYARVLKRDLLVKSFPSPGMLVGEYHAIQRSIPEGSSLLTRTDQSYGFDFTRNQILIADFPGSASLPPGMPIDKNSKVLKEYLLQHSVRYVAYSYSDYSNFPPSICEYRTTQAFWRENPIEAREAAAACIIQDNFSALGLSQKRLYDDGKIYVLDLAQPVS